MNQDPSQPAPDDLGHRRALAVEDLISDLLRIGVAVSLSVVLLGTILSFVRHPDYFSTPSELARLTKPGTAFPHSLIDVLRGARQLEGRSIVLIGLLLLIATPVMRVAVSIIVFIHRKDLLFVIFTAIVLFLLLLSFFLGKSGG